VEYPLGSDSSDLWKKIIYQTTYVVPMSKKIILVVLAVFLVPLFIASAQDALQIKGPALTASHSENPAVVKDEIVIAGENGNRVQWRHIILKGNNTEIGMALGQIAERDFDVKSLSKYSDPIYGKARQAYMEENCPPMSERMIGIAKAFGLHAGDAIYDATTLPYDAGSMACSIVYFPPKNMTSGHAVASRNTEWYLVPVDVYLNNTDKGTGNAAASRDFIMEIYPDKGYSTIAIGMMDLNSVIDGLNSEGLGISMLEDTFMGLSTKSPVDGRTDSGINNLQIARLILENCRTVEEAKMAFLNNRIFFTGMGSHYMVYDSFGNSTIVEWNKTSGNVVFTDGSNNKPNIMTNFPIYLYTKYSLKDLPREPDLIPYNDPYDSFRRYITLSNITSSHEGRISEAEAASALGAVSTNTVIAAEGSMAPLPINTIYHVLMDLNNRSMNVKFYLMNGPIDPKTDRNTSIYSPYFTFRLNNSAAGT
jgi:hypothetical protein